MEWIVALWGFVEYLLESQTAQTIGIIGLLCATADLKDRYKRIDCQVNQLLAKACGNEAQHGSNAVMTHEEDRNPSDEREAFRQHQGEPDGGGVKDE